MKATIAVQSRQEADYIRAALEDPATRAVAVILGALQPLPETAKQRVWTYISEVLNDTTDSNTE